MQDGGSTGVATDNGQYRMDNGNNPAENDLCACTPLIINKLGFAISSSNSLKDEDNWIVDGIKIYVCRGALRKGGAPPGGYTDVFDAPSVNMGPRTWNKGGIFPFTSKQRL